MRSKLSYQDILDLHIEVHVYRNTYKDTRLGQAYFNCLFDKDPELADFIRNTDKDPFYDNNKLPIFLYFISLIEAKN